MALTSLQQIASAGLQTAQRKKDLSLTLQRKPLSTLDNLSRYALSYIQRVLVPGDPVPDNLLECRDAATISKYLYMFVLETRKADGTNYSPGSIRSLLSELNRVLKEKAPFSVLDDQFL